MDQFGFTYSGAVSIKFNMCGWRRWMDPLLPKERRLPLERGDTIIYCLFGAGKRGVGREEE